MIRKCYRSVQNCEIEFTSVAIVSKYKYIHTLIVVDF